MSAFFLNQNHVGSPLKGRYALSRSRQKPTLLPYGWLIFAPPLVVGICLIIGYFFRFTAIQCFVNEEPCSVELRETILSSWRGKLLLWTDWQLSYSQLQQAVPLFYNYALGSVTANLPNSLELHLIQREYLVQLSCEESILLVLPDGSVVASLEQFSGLAELTCVAGEMFEYGSGKKKIVQEYLPHLNAWSNSRYSKTSATVNSDGVFRWQEQGVSILVPLMKLQETLPLVPVALQEIATNPALQQGTVLDFRFELPIVRMGEI